MSDMGWSRHIRDLDAAAEMEMEAEGKNMLAALDEHCDFASPHELYRSVYKYTECGPWMSMLVNGGWVHCGELHTLGTWKQMLERKMIVTELLFGSIVEGVDQCADEVSVTLADMTHAEHGVKQETVMAAIYGAVERVNEDARAIWNDTHGCDTCVDHWGGESAAIWDECPDCLGEGDII